MAETRLVLADMQALGPPPPLPDRDQSRLRSVGAAGAAGASPISGAPSSSASSPALLSAGLSAPAVPTARPVSASERGAPPPLAGAPPGLPSSGPSMSIEFKGVVTAEAGDEKKRLPAAAALETPTEGEPRPPATAGATPRGRRLLRPDSKDAGAAEALSSARIASAIEEAERLVSEFRFRAAMRVYASLFERSAARSDLAEKRSGWALSVAKIGRDARVQKEAMIQWATKAIVIKEAKDSTVIAAFKLVVKMYREDDEDDKADIFINTYCDRLRLPAHTLSKLRIECAAQPSEASEEPPAATGGNSGSHTPLLFGFLVLTFFATVFLMAKIEQLQSAVRQLHGRAEAAGADQSSLGTEFAAASDALAIGLALRWAEPLGTALAVGVVVVGFTVLTLAALLGATRRLEAGLATLLAAATPRGGAGPKTQEALQAVERNTGEALQLIKGTLSGCGLWVRRVCVAAAVIASVWFVFCVGAWTQRRF